MKLFNHQKQAIRRASKGSCCLFHEPGCGKTASMLKTIEKIGGPALVVCPISIIEPAWLDDCKKFTPELDAVSLWQPKPEDRLRILREDHDIYVTGFDQFRIMFDDIQKRKWNALVVDESSAMKNPKSQRTQALLGMAGVYVRGCKYRSNQVVPYRYCLSGTPAPNSEMEYWAQLTFVAPGRAFNSNFYAFRGKYFRSIPLGATGVNIFKFRGAMREDLMKSMTPFCHVVRKADALDLPEQVDEMRKVYLSDKEAKAYFEMEKTFVLRFAEETVLASNALVEIMKLRQLTSGFAYGTEGVHKTGDSKFKVLMELLEELGPRQSIIWCNFKTEIEAIKAKLGDKCCTLYGGTPDRQKSITDFTSGKVQYLIANPMSAGHGLTFTNCDTEIYYSLNYSYELHAQSRDRIHRIGQDMKCTYYYLVAAGTIDELIYKVLQGKAELSSSVLEYLKEHTG